MGELRNEFMKDSIFEAKTIMETMVPTRSKSPINLVDLINDRLYGGKSPGSYRLTLLDMYRMPQALCFNVDQMGNGHEKDRRFGFPEPSTGASSSRTGRRSSSFAAAAAAARVDYEDSVSVSVPMHLNVIGHDVDNVVRLLCRGSLLPHTLLQSSIFDGEDGAIDATMHAFERLQEANLGMVLGVVFSYQLCAVIFDFAYNDNDHRYTALTLNRSDGQWYYYNDDDVYSLTIPVEDVLLQMGEYISVVSYCIPPS
jgi:hypothetical protein